MRLGVFCPVDSYPENGPPQALYGRVLDEAVHAERVGLESFWVAEHHFAPYGVAPDPAVLLSAIAARTAHLRLGTATSVLPLHDPLQLAETYALLDQVSGGRLEFGAGSGYLRYEFAGFGVDPAEKRERFDEALDVLRVAWSGRPIRFSGRFHRIDTPPLNVLPLQPGGPPVHVGITRAPAAPFVGGRGLHLANVPYITLQTLPELADLVAAYRQALPPGVRTQVTVAMHTFCGTEPWRGPDDPAYAEVEAALDRYLRTRVVPGARYNGRPIARDFVLFGNHEQLAARVRALGSLGIDRLLLLASFGGLSGDVVTASLGRAARLAAA